MIQTNIVWYLEAVMCKIKLKMMITDRWPGFSSFCPTQRGRSDRNWTPTHPRYCRCRSPGLLGSDLSQPQSNCHQSSFSWGTYSRSIWSPWTYDSFCWFLAESRWSYVLCWYKGKLGRVRQSQLLQFWLPRILVFGVTYWCFPRQLPFSLPDS